MINCRNSDCEFQCANDATHGLCFLCRKKEKAIISKKSKINVMNKEKKRLREIELLKESNSLEISNLNALVLSLQVS